MNPTGLMTAYGPLKGVVSAEYYGSGGIKECTLKEKNILGTQFGIVIPQYENDSVRRKNSTSMTFYESGTIKSISFQGQTNIPTSLGSLPAELATFYESGAVKRIFPLNGKLSGFWSEKNEYQLAPALDLRLPSGSVVIKPVSLYFYESGRVKSITLWPGESLTVPTPAGNVDVRNGVSFYEDGAVKSVEPLKSMSVKTPIGEISAYDIEAVGISADINSLVFDSQGRIKSLKTWENKISVASDDGNGVTISPASYLSHFDDELKRIEPITITFEKGNVFINEMHFRIAEYTFKIGRFTLASDQTGNGCAGCDFYE